MKIYIIDLYNWNQFVNIHTKTYWKIAECNLWKPLHLAIFSLNTSTAPVLVEFPCAWPYFEWPPKLYGNFTTNYRKYKNSWTSNLIGQNLKQKGSGFSDCSAVCHSTSHFARTRCWLITRWVSLYLNAFMSFKETPKRSSAETGSSDRIGIINVHLRAEFGIVSSICCGIELNYNTLILTP